MPDVGIREFARRVGMSHPWVLKMIDKGRFKKKENGKLDLDETLVAFHAYQAESAVKDKLPDGVNPIDALNEAKARKEAHLADIKYMEAQALRGEFVTIAEVEADARAVAERLRSFCLSAPSRYSGLLENRSQRDAEAVLQDVFNELLSSIHDGKFLSE